MASTAQERYDATLSKINIQLDAQTRRLELSEAREAAAHEAARAQRERDAMFERTEIGARYADAFRSFGAEPPMPADNEPVARYRARLFDRLARRLPPGHELSDIRADGISSQPVVLDHFEKLIIEAAALEGAAPSLENLPSDGTIIERHRNDDLGQRMTEFYGRESFIKDFTRPGRKVVAIRNPRDNTVLWGQPLRQAR